MEKDNLNYYSNLIVFREDIAKSLGLKAAIVCSYIEQQIRIYKCFHIEDDPNVMHIYGTTYIRLPINKIKNDLPFLSENSIKKAIKTLIEEAYFIKEKLNESKGDTSYWYALF